MNEPLKDKRIIVNEYLDADCFNFEDVKSAIEWLKQQPYTRIEEDSKDGEEFFEIIIMKKSDFEKAFTDLYNIQEK